MIKASNRNKNTVSVLYSYKSSVYMAGKMGVHTTSPIQLKTGNTNSIFFYTDHISVK